LDEKARALCPASASGRHRDIEMGCGGLALVSRSYRGHVSIAAPCLSVLALTRLAQRWRKKNIRSQAALKCSRTLL